MIWSVSTLLRRSGSAVPVWVVNLSTDQHLLFDVGGRAQPARDRGGRRDQRRDEMGPAALALPALEVAVRRGRRPLPRCELVGVHAEAHRAACGAPLGSGLL